VPLPSLTAFREAAECAGAPWLDVNPALRDRPDRLELYYRRDGPWTLAGHRAIAEIVADVAETTGLLPDPVAH
jgi:hypothetical protein